ncbi:MAG: sigma-70 family RNA polymerase sigma factor [Candidatus Omnitrophica bacterium]|nr:sigma-70 family RNA polymerase sigma factor [Candidatus Omnitrophota bacterium]
MTFGNFETLSDEDLVLEFQRGDESAFDHLVRRYQEKSTGLAFSMLRNWETAKEVSQSAFVKAYFGLKNFKRESKFGTWFYRIVANQSRDEIRKRMRSKAEIPVEAILMTQPSSELSPRSALELEEERLRLEKSVADLPQNEQRVFVMRYFNEMPLQEISDVLGVALGTVKSSLFHATQKVRHALALKEVSRNEP